MNTFLGTTPFDLYELTLFQLVVKHGSFTKAAELAGLTQSAITRQMQGMERGLGVDLLERTTRSVRVTSAGEFLFRESVRLLGDVDQLLRRLQVEFAGARKEVRVGVSLTIGLAYLPGFFHANLRRLPDPAIRVNYARSDRILSALEANELDIGVLCSPQRLPRTLRATHRFRDAFTLIAPASLAQAFNSFHHAPQKRIRWLLDQNWLMIDDRSSTGGQIRAWMARQHLRVDPTMHLDSFDLIINLVALGMGVSFVPRRALALYGRKRTLVRLPMPARFERELVVVVRASRKLPEHLHAFIKNILFQD